MCQLDAGMGTLCVQEVHNASQGGDVLILPDTQVLGRDAAFGRHGCGFRENQASSTDGTAAKVNEMPVGGESILAGILTHGRNGDAVWEGDTAQRERRKKTCGLAHLDGCLISDWRCSNCGGVEQPLTYEMLRRLRTTQQGWQSKGRGMVCRGPWLDHYHALIVLLVGFLVVLLLLVVRLLLRRRRRLLLAVLLRCLLWHRLVMLRRRCLLWHRLVVRLWRRMRDQFLILLRPGWATLLNVLDLLRFERPAGMLVHGGLLLLEGRTRRRRLVAVDQRLLSLLLIGDRRKGLGCGLALLVLRCRG